jgi:hypothetical protein
MTDEAETGKRQEKRDSLFLSASVRVSDALAFTTRVRNLSPGGMMIDSATDLQVGAVVVADVRGIGEIKGRIAWSSFGRAGVAFDVEIDPRLARAGPSGKKTLLPDYLRTAPNSRRSGLAIR